MPKIWRAPANLAGGQLRGDLPATKERSRYHPGCARSSRLTWNCDTVIIQPVGLNQQQPKHVGARVVMLLRSPGDVLAKGVVLGTPRTYGDRRTEDIWRRTITNGSWNGIPRLLSCQLPLNLDFEFRVNPFSSRYNGNVSRNGPDLDTGNERFFDGPPTSEFGYDDSVVYRLICAQVQACRLTKGCIFLAGCSANYAFGAL
jgi:hypothetical protein